MAKKKQQTPDGDLDMEQQQPGAGDAEEQQQPGAGDAKQPEKPTLVRVRLPAIVERRGGCLVDRGNGVMISTARYDDDGAMLVERSAFVMTALDAGDLILVD